MIQPAPATGKRQSAFLKRQFPTLLGLILLVVGLGIAAVLFGQGTGIFLPRASPETTPKNIRVSNVSDDGFYVTFLTDVATAGFVRYGTEKNKYQQVGDERDQLSGTVGEYTLHHIRIKGLQPSTTYYYVLGTGKGALFDDGGEPFVIRTAARTGTQPRVSNAYGTLMNQNGTPAEGAVVFVTAPGAGTQSSLVRNSGGWSVSLSNARTKDGSGFADIPTGTEVVIQVQGTSGSQKMDTTATITSNQAIDLVFGAQNSGSASGRTNGDSNSLPNESNGSPTQYATSSPTLADNLTSLATQSSQFSSSLVDSSASSSATKSALLKNNLLLATSSANASASANATASAEPLVVVLDLEKASESAQPVVETTRPTITGTAKPNVVINVQINSETKINTQATADDNGEFYVDLDELGKDLEPGNHSITYSYVDPMTGETITETQEFVVNPRPTYATSNTNSNLAQAQAMATPRPTPTPTPATPYGTSNPYPIDSSPKPSTGSAVASPSASASPSATPRSTIKPATNSGTLMNSGSVSTTALLLAGGLFFIVSGIWSWWISRELAVVVEE